MQVTWKYCICRFTLAFCRTFPLVALMEGGLFLIAEAELTGSDRSVVLFP